MSISENTSAKRHRYWGWISVLLVVFLGGLFCYLRQLAQGLVITGLSRDVSWGLYIGQFTFFVGIAASAVTVVLPYYLHDCKSFARLTVLGELLAISAVIVSALFIFVDLGQPARIFYIILYPQPQSVMFWDMIALGGYLLMNIVIARTALRTEREHIAAPAWLKPLIFVSIPWAISIHTVTAFLYSGLPGRTYWLTALLAPRFLASAFCSGPALLILLSLAMKKWTDFDIGNEALQKLSIVITYAAAANIFLMVTEVFTAFYSEIPDHENAFAYLFIGANGDFHIVPWMWVSFLLSLVGLTLLLVPKWRTQSRFLITACVCTFTSIWLDKGLGFIIGGLVPSPLGTITRYAPTLPEWSILCGIWAIGALMVTTFYRITLSVWEED